jgi:hypothetical protein
MLAVAWALACLSARTTLGEPPAAPPEAASQAQPGMVRIAELEAELARIRERLDRAPGEQARSDTCFHDPDGPVDRWRFYAGVEFCVVKPRFEDGAEEDRSAAILDYKMALAPRAWVGWLHPEGAGLRTRYWQFHQSSEVSQAEHFPIAGPFEQMSIEAHTIDLECTQAMDFRRWAITLAGGVRYAIFEQRVDSLEAPDFAMRRFYAAGPTCCLENRMPLWDTQLALFFSARGSLLVGESRWANPATGNHTDDIGATLDMQLGLEREWELRCGRSLFCRASWEQQHWFGAGTFFDGSLTGPGAILAIQQDDHDVALMGYTVAVGATW